MLRFLYFKIYFIFYYRIKKLKNFSFKYIFFKFFSKIPILKNKDINIKFYAPNYLTYCRARDFFKNKVGRGRNIVEWLANFESDKVFFDIGSNIGIYSLYVCSLRKNISVYSFEPSANNLRVYQEIFL